MFLATVVTAYGVTALLEADKARAAVAAFLPMLGIVAPVLLLVLALMILSERSLRRGGRALAGRDSGPRAWLIAAGAGAIATGPVYPWYALLAELRRKGMQPALAAVLLYARAVKLPLLPAHGPLLRCTLHPGAVRLDPGVRVAQRPRDATLRNQRAPNGDAKGIDGVL